MSSKPVACGFDIALMFLDVNMPVISGFEILQWKVEQNYNEIKILPVIILTGLSDLDAIRKGYSMGASSFLTKPLRGEEAANLLTTFSHLFATNNPEKVPEGRDQVPN